MDYSKLNAVVMADKIPRGTGNTDRLTMLRRLGFTSPEIIDGTLNTSNDDIYAKAVIALPPQSISLIDYLSPNEGKFKLGSFLALDKSGEFVNIALEAIKIIRDVETFAKEKGNELEQKVKDSIENLTEENDAGKDFDRVDKEPETVLSTIKKIGRPKK